MSAFDSVIYWDVDSGDLTQSGQTLLQKIFRIAEGLLGISKNWGKKRNKLWANFEECTAALSKSNKQILLVVQDIHEGQHAYRQESITVLEVFNQLADTNITAVATTHEGVLKNNLFHDHFLNWPVPEELEDANLIAAIKRYATTDTHRGVLSVLGEADTNGVHLFEICDRLEEKQLEAFEPAVEYALWDLRPLLSIQRQRRDIEGKQENARLWSIFSDQLKAHL